MRNRIRFAIFVLHCVCLLTFVDQLAAQNTQSRDGLLSTKDVLRVVNNKEWVLVDTRTSDAYNGWALDGIQYGGHLPRAVDFPASWLDIDHQDKAAKLADTLHSKGIEREKHIVLYSTNRRDRTRVASYLRNLGFRQIYLFDLKNWIQNASPLKRHKNFHLLVPASIVKQLLDGHLPETFQNASRLKFVEVSWGNENASYAKGHIPRSFHVNTDDFEPPPRWMLGSPQALTQFAAKYGFHADDTVIVSSQKPTASYRLAIVLRYMGVQDVRVLNGGLTAWKAKYPVETKRHSPPKVASFGATIPKRPKLIDDISQVKVGLRTPSKFMLVDNRTWSEFVGETSGYKYHFRKGRIPGSTYGQPGFTGANSLAPYRNIDNTMRNADEILALWKKAGISTEKHLSFMCGGGWRAAEVLTFAQVIGIRHASLYSDGWIGWSNDPKNPIESGRVQYELKPDARSKK